MEITALCKVVDNFGDIGVVWRLCKNLKKIDEHCIVNLIVDDLVSFNKICSKVSIDENLQLVDGIHVYAWNAAQFCYDSFSCNDGEKLSVILECFQCGRPEWMEKILFEDKLQRTVQIIMIDYLTAEKYAEDFHCLDSLTRSKKVRKVNFMPGFTEKTGGLIIDDEWKSLSQWNKTGKVLVFTYEKNWNALCEALQICGKNVLLAQGRGKESFLQSCDGLDVEELPFMNQEQWDIVMKNCSALVIRGEESMSRACLSGIPFVWHAYPQSDEYQMVKVNALLERMSKHFKADDFEKIKKVWLGINSSENECDNEQMKIDWVNFLNSVPDLVYGYKEFAEELRKNGDLCYNLMTFINKICII